jgi:hypothetical protein
MDRNIVSIISCPRMLAPFSDFWQRRAAITCRPIFSGIKIHGECGSDLKNSSTFCAEMIEQQDCARKPATRRVFGFQPYAAGGTE